MELPINYLLIAHGMTLHRQYIVLPNIFRSFLSDQEMYDMAMINYLADRGSVLQCPMPVELQIILNKLCVSNISDAKPLYNQEKTERKRKLNSGPIRLNREEMHFSKDSTTPKLFSSNLQDCKNTQTSFQPTIIYDLDTVEQQSVSLSEILLRLYIYHILNYSKDTKFILHIFSCRILNTTTILSKGIYPLKTIQTMQPDSKIDVLYMEDAYNSYIIKSGIPIYILRNYAYYYEKYKNNDQYLKRHNNWFIFTPDELVILYRNMYNKFNTLIERQKYKLLAQLDDDGAVQKNNEFNVEYEDYLANFLVDQVKSDKVLGSQLEQIKTQFTKKLKVSFTHKYLKYKHKYLNLLEQMKNTNIGIRL